MENYDLHEFNNTDYYLASDLHDYSPEFFYGCKNNIKNIISKKEIPDDELHYAYEKDGKWIDSHENYCRAKLFISKEWIYDNVPGLNEELEAEIEKMPPRIELKDEERWIDDDGEPYQICVRGERNPKGIYFRASDVADMLDNKKLTDTLTNKNSEYEQGKDYKFFICTISKTISNSKSKKSIKGKSLYLTYRGILRVFFCSRKKKVADKFVEWAMETLFVHQFGSQKQKRELASRLLGVPTDVMKKSLAANANEISSIYFILLGKVKDLRRELKISKDLADDDLVCKWGRTGDLKRRLTEHEKTYSFAGQIEVLSYGYIDPQFVSKAESRVKHLFEGMSMVLSHKKYNELAIVPKKKLNIVHEQFDTISKAFMGKLSELIAQLESVKKDNEISLLKKDTQIMRLESEKAILEKDLEICNLKLQLKSK